MKININDQLPEAEVFRLINGDPKKISISDLLKNKKLFYLDFLELTHLFVRQNICLVMLITLINLNLKV